MRSLIIAIFIFIPVVLLAQKDNDMLKHYQDSIKKCFSEIISTSNDSVKVNNNNRIIYYFEKILDSKESFIFPFDSLKNMGIFTSPDKKFRLYNWNIQFANGEFEYSGFLQVNDEELKTMLVFPLIDKSKEIKNPEHETTTNENWFGALYYQIIMIKEKNTTYYTLLGWDGNNDFTNRKIIEVLYFTDDGKPKFGKNIFKLEDERKKRIIFEYSYLASMALNFNEKLNMIIYDHLAPSSSRLEGQYQYYGPDFSYDGLYFKNGKWNEEKNIDVRNPKSKNVRKKNISYTF